MPCLKNFSFFLKENIYTEIWPTSMTADLRDIIHWIQVLVNVLFFYFRNNFFLVFFEANRSLWIIFLLNIKTKFHEKYFQIVHPCPISVTVYQCSAASQVATRQVTWSPSRVSLSQQRCWEPQVVLLEVSSSKPSRLAMSNKFSPPPPSDVSNPF